MLLYVADESNTSELDEGDDSGSSFDVDEEQESPLHSSSESETSNFGEVPASREKRRKKKQKQQIVSSDDEENSDDDKLEKEGNPLEVSTEPNDIVLGQNFTWRKVKSSSTKFPWVKSFSQVEHSGFREIRKADFFRKDPFQLLQLFVPIQWYEEITKETNRFVYPFCGFRSSISYILCFLGMQDSSIFG